MGKTKLVEGQRHCEVRKPSKTRIPPIPVAEVVFENLPDDSLFQEFLDAWYAGHRDSACVLALDSVDALPQPTSALVIAMVKQRYSRTKDPFWGGEDGGQPSYRYDDDISR